ncbi:KGGVGR-motif variant AAA ATPase [Aeromonas veronii]|uniref:KGGVGR-motif variant AAA ATPase n=1 Tax=Aeromonas veronii TaxID=654 RepID=UPI00187F302D|nr:AAA family ATPase [Aeromonas veronii]MBE8735505.1 AAA family ATPase [Aeromonas veronii]MBE8739394.1 AAA family ATPase [Aeromonas veronii]MBE8744163.1 AAA family ATPase [Aeromonas veronii]MBE8765434.1 AAA family ATPase [Aeromonas veronii]MBE8841456.1 AAA family ATPase [Aeromonas veronii]
MVVEKYAVRYDDVLPLTLQIATQICGESFFVNNLLLRDAEGFITIVLREDMDTSLRNTLSNELSRTLGVYATTPPVVTPEEIFDPSLKDITNDKFEFITCPNGYQDYVRYIERRIVGGDWVRSIQQPIFGKPKVVVFSSLKGGVGRSTALSVAAIHLAKKGKSVLAIDLDLEAPGIGGMFLEKSNLPSYGALDFYVEFGRTDITPEFLSDMRKEAYRDASGGSFTIVPATGLTSQNTPQNVLGKISRAYLEVMSATGEPVSFLDKTRELITQLCDNNSYDVIFVDARAGLNESTAATIHGLGADVLFFGVDTPQTWDGYKYFLAHLARHKTEADPQEDWRYKIKIIHAKATNSRESLVGFRDRSCELFSSYLYDEIDGEEVAEGLTDAFGFDLDDTTAPHYAWPIFMSKYFYEYNPLDENSRQNTEELVQPVFGVFLEKLCERLGH